MLTSITQRVLKIVEQAENRKNQIEQSIRNLKNKITEDKVKLRAHESITLSSFQDANQDTVLHMRMTADKKKEAMNEEH